LYASAAAVMMLPPRNRAGLLPDPATSLGVAA
jgi:hypothetical protein